MAPIRFVTAAGLFDGHDASINIIRRLLQASGAEVIHLGHNRSASEVVKAAIEEDAHAVAISSYQGGHNEYFRYVRKLLDESGAQNVKIFGGGGGVITDEEIKALEADGIEKIYSADEGVAKGLKGIIDDMLQRASYSTLDNFNVSKVDCSKLSARDLAKIITLIEETGEVPAYESEKNTLVLGITGTGGAGKSSLIDEMLLRFHLHISEFKIALLSVDPTKKKSQGALLGDRIRLGCASLDQFFVRSLATRNSKTELSPQIEKVIKFLKGLDFDLILVETSGIGQASDEILKVADKTVYVMTPEYGASTQLEKIEMLEGADFIVINKFEKMRSEDALRDVRKQYRRNHQLFAGGPNSVSDDDLPVYGTMASRFNDEGVNALFIDIVNKLDLNKKASLLGMVANKAPKVKSSIIPAGRILYLREISEVVKRYNESIKIKVDLLKKFEAVQHAYELLPDVGLLDEKKNDLKGKIGPEVFELIDQFDVLISKMKSGVLNFKIRNKEIKQQTKIRSLSGLDFSKVGIPRFEHLSDKYRFIKEQNLPGYFPFATGVFPFKREGEDPKRMFAGEGGPLKTNARFHYLCQGEKAKRLSTAFDSVTLYGEDPHERPDIFGKIGESGVSICTLDDMTDLYKGFDLCDPMTSVSMTINGPAPIILAFFMNTAINQSLDEKDRSDVNKCREVMRKVRGTVQADILKEDQAQNTCIFSLEFALKLMCDVQEFFSNNKINNYYTVSISGYHIAEAGANPISQLAFTLANGFTYVEAYLARGIPIDSFCENLSFFFSNGLDPEYTVIGRVARKIWAVTMKEKYGASTNSQKLKYHIQTSGRSLHAQEVDFNDIRTTLQAFLALSDNCNSLHTNAFDEAVTTPTQESVRRAMAIQLIINKEFGLNKTDNPLQGSFIYDELCELVEQAVLEEFERISDKGGVLGSMESMYQRSKIQEESLYYETLKGSGELPIIGVNTFLNDNASEVKPKLDITRSTDTEKYDQIKRLQKFQGKNKNQSAEALSKLKKVILDGQNIFEELLNTTKYCSLGQITALLYEVGGRYRRNM